MKRLSGTSLTLYPSKTKHIYDGMTLYFPNSKMLGDISCKSFPLNDIYEIRDLIYKHYPVRPNLYLSNAYIVSEAKRKLKEIGGANLRFC